MGSKTPLTNALLAKYVGDDTHKLQAVYGVLTDHARRLEYALAVAEKVVRLSDELCTAVDNAAEDIGGSRRTGDILADLGPATYEALVAIEKIKGGV